jgi:hypothetical protein
MAAEEAIDPQYLCKSAEMTSYELCLTQFRDIARALRALTGSPESVIERNASKSPTQRKPTWSSPKSR